MVIADLDMALIIKRKRMMDSVGHYARPELLSLAINDRPAHDVVTDAPHSPIERPSHEPLNANASTVGRRAEQLIDELQSYGAAARRSAAGAARREPPRRRGSVRSQGGDDRRHDRHGAGAYGTAWHSPSSRATPDAQRHAARSMRGTIPLANISFPTRRASTSCRRSTACRIRISRRCMVATCWRRRCCRPASATKAARKTCQFCAIGQSLAAGRTIARKTPAQLAEVARAAVLLDGVKHMVMTTGTPPTQRSRRADPLRKRVRDQGRRRPADPGAMRAARR